MKSRVVDFSTFIGIAVCLAILLWAMTLGGHDKLAVLISFIDVPAVLIVLVGTLAVTTACFSIEEVLGMRQLLARTIAYRSENPSDSAKCSLALAELARKQGFLHLENAETLWKHNPILKKGVRMMIDGIVEDQVMRSLSEDVNAMVDRHTNGILILRKAAEISPAMGLIGTLIGLVHMLGSLDDPSSIGPAMAIALLTTFYGALMSFVIYVPLATKLERNTRAEVSTARIYLRTIESIFRKENPRQLEIGLNSLMQPTKRIHYFDKNAAKNEAE